MSELNRSQKEAVEYRDGALLVLAGPGSGKTTVITHRALELAKTTDAQRILVITFTRSAAADMKKRFDELDEDGVGMGVTFSTFHALFFSVLKAAYGYNSSNILRPEVRTRFFREIMEELKLTDDADRELLEKIDSAISFVKASGIDAQYYYPIDCPKEIFLAAYKSYESKLLSGGLIDFDDMQLMSRELFYKRPDILGKWQDRYDYILVDEAQDTSAIQYELVKMLAKRGNLMLVGDDDQSIYRFRGARPEIMLGFKKDFPDGKIITLDVNYRSPQQISKMSLRLIGNNRDRYDKRIEAARRTDEDAVSMTEYKDASEQNSAVLNRIKTLHEEGVAYGEMAVLCRTGHTPRSMVEYFLRWGLPFQMRDVLPNIYEHWIYKDIEAYLELASGRDAGSLLRIINKPARYISRNAFTTRDCGIEQLFRAYSDKDYVVERLRKLEYDLRMIASMKPGAAVHYIRHVIGYDDYIKSYAEYRGVGTVELFETMEELEDAAMSYDTYEAWQEGIASVKEELARMARERDEREDKVSVMTYHSAKGLEFDHVFLPDVNLGVTPYKKARDEAELEEERRMFYVAFTRARKHVYVSWLDKRYNKPCEISPYVGELIASVKDFCEGARIYHVSYGEGVIKKAADGKLTVAFDTQRRDRTLDLNHCVSRRLIKVVG